MRIPSASRRDNGTSAPGASPPRRWVWRFLWDAVIVYSLYQLYEMLRAKVAGTEAGAYHHALQIMGLERALHISWEHGAQHRLMAHVRVLQFWDIYYGTAHFVTPVVVLILLYRWWPERYRRWRNTLGWTVGIALVAFAFYPLMPPRLLPSSYGFVDTATRFGGLGRLDRGSMKDVENLYAAMPSLHIAWATWSACALVPVLRPKWAKALVTAYPCLTLVCVLVTANHWILDVVGALAVLGLGHLAAGAWDARHGWSRRLAGRGAVSAPGAGVVPAAVRGAVPTAIATAALPTTAPATPSAATVVASSAPAAATAPATSPAVAPGGGGG